MKTIFIFILFFPYFSIFQTGTWGLRIDLFVPMVAIDGHLPIQEVPYQRYNAGQNKMCT